MSRRAAQREPIDSTVWRKTVELIAAKQAYDSLVGSVEEEFDRSIAQLGEETVHVSLSLARNCVTAIRRNRSLLPSVIEDLKQSQETEEPLDDELDDPQPYRRASHSARVKGIDEEDEDEALKSDSQGSDDSIPNLQGISLDAETYYKQYDHEELDLNAFQDLEDSD
jgi:hypothetical protein